MNLCDFQKVLGLMFHVEHFMQLVFEGECLFYRGPGVPRETVGSVRRVISFC